ncbi:T9SS type A sorting domain-containing protein [Seonamhaeicola marinus]|uniref:T9SS type A sorting domain-containing protein n=1 Tax=Seonamhaeicola marinus TaxID=1912246 RepID=A0A5D0IK71_9FLAO|nr:T9SS type A sorting domain-containing protein [Seonamhaeicola marinus]TYA84283.1 T9SS type A sorting domain-containing protein [Seonamhaeicola marinus]
MNSHILRLAFSLFLSINAFSQTGPGGVGTNDSSSSLKLWLDASKGVTLSGSDVTTWADLSGSSNNATPPSTAARPNLNTADINGYNSIHFDGINDEFRVTDNSSLDLTSWDIFIVTKADLNKNYNALFVKGQDAQENYEFLTYGAAFFHTPIRFTDGSRNHSNSASGLYSTTDFDLYEYSFSSSVGRDVYKNNTNIITDNESRTPRTNNIDLYIGNENVGGRHLNGRISEFLIFNTPLNTAEKIIVQNYLSAKYDVSLSSNDFYVHDNASNGDFDHNVAGIGQASDGSNHTDSKGTGIVRISKGSLSGLNNGEFLFWGEETQFPTYNFSTNTITHTEQLNSKWRVRRSGGNPGRVNISFDISGMDLSGKQGCQPLQLVVDNDSDFSMTDPNDEVYDLTITGTTATATNVRLRQNRYFTLRYTDEIIWDGAAFCNGSGSAEAPNDTDECLKLTVKSGANAVISSDAHVREIEIESGGTLIINDGVLLEVENFIQTNGTIELQGEAQLIQNHTSISSNGGTGILVKRQQGATNLYNYNFWSAPVNNGGSWQIGDIEEPNGVINFHSNPDANAATMPITLSSRWLYSYNGLSGSSSTWNKLNTTSTLSPGIGYTMKGSGAASSEQDYIFKGTPNDGNYSIPIAAGNDILIGNPYPSAIDADEFINDNLAVINGSLYFWEHFGTNNSHYQKDYEGGYAIRNLLMGTAAVAGNGGNTSTNGSASKPAPLQHIPVGQGFFVRASATGGNIQFNNSQRAFARESLSESVFYKGKAKKSSKEVDKRTKVWFSFTQPGKFTKQLGLGFDSRASKAYDNGYDAISYDNFRNDISWILNEENLAIQALSHINVEESIALRVKISDEGLFNFEIDKVKNLPEGLDIFLKDNTTNSFYELSTRKAELFLEQGDYNDRFSIVFKQSQSLSVTDRVEEKLSVFYDKSSGKIVLNNVTNFEEIQELKIYNSVGQEVKTLKALSTNKVDFYNYSDGVYIVNIVTDNAQKTGKVIKF